MFGWINVCVFSQDGKTWIWLRLAQYIGRYGSAQLANVNATCNPDAHVAMPAQMKYVVDDEALWMQVRKGKDGSGSEVWPRSRLAVTLL